MVLLGELIAYVRCVCSVGPGTFISIYVHINIHIEGSPSPSQCYYPRTSFAMPRFIMFIPV